MPATTQIVGLPIIDFKNSDLCAAPFDHFILARAFSEEKSLQILDWLERSAPWKLVAADFYTQYEFDFEEVVLPEEIVFLTQRRFLVYLISHFERIFKAKLSAQVDITAHKLIKGHTIRLHNDYIAGQETHRLIIQLNRGWKNENGGFLIFFNSSDPADIDRVINPAHNSAVGFAISPSSNHAVSTIHDGERYTIVYSFYGANNSHHPGR